jgi:hypothetical protein
MAVASNLTPTGAASGSYQRPSPSGSLCGAMENRNLTNLST